MLDEEYYAVSIHKIKEIIGYRQLTRIPNQPAFVKGVIDIRGQAVPVIDPRNKFDLLEKNYDQFTVILVLFILKKTIGIIVDNVSDVTQFEDEAIQEAPKFQTKIDSNYITGVVRKDDKFIIILDIDMLLFENELNRI